MEHETEVGQRFVIDLELSADLSESSRTDRLADTVSYSNVVATATAAFKNANYKLLERAAGAVAEAVLAAFPRVSAIKVTVHKPHAPIAAIFEDVGVVLTGAAGKQPFAWLTSLIALGGNVGDVRATFRKAISNICGMTQAALLRAIVRLRHAALGRRGAGALRQCLHRDRDQPRSPCAVVHAAQDRAQVRPRPRQGTRWGSAPPRPRL